MNGFTDQGFEQKIFGVFRKTGGLSFSGRLEISSCEVVVRFAYKKPSIKYAENKEFFFQGKLAKGEAIQKGSSMVNRCQKPVLVLKQIIERYTADNDLVMDLCCGTGSTSVACAVVGKRHCFSLDFDDNQLASTVNRLSDTFSNLAKWKNLYQELEEEEQEVELLSEPESTESQDSEAEPTTLEENSAAEDNPEVSQELVQPKKRKRKATSQGGRPKRQKKS